MNLILPLPPGEGRGEGARGEGRGEGADAIPAFLPCPPDSPGDLLNSKQKRSKTTRPEK